MDVQITPEPTAAEREAIIRALELERDTDGEPTPWQNVGLGGDAAAPESGGGARVVQP